MEIFVLRQVHVDSSDCSAQHFINWSGLVFGSFFYAYHTFEEVRIAALLHTYREDF